MGHVKQMAMEQADAGFSYMGSEVVCESCIRDPALSAYVKKHGFVDLCDFCGGGEHVVVLGLNDLFMFMGEQIRLEFEPAHLSQALPSPEWGMDVPRVESLDLLKLLGDPLADEALHAQFCDAFDCEWIERDCWFGPHHERLSQSWVTFVTYVRSRSRFVFLHPDAGCKEEFEPSYIPPGRMLDALRDMIQTHDRVCRLGCAAPIHRGRSHRPVVEFTSCSDLGPPHPSQTLGQRMSPRGISSFYGAVDEQTSLAELRGVEGDVVSVASWRATRDCWIVDLVNLPPPPSIFDPARASDRPTARFLRSFADAISAPVHHEDDREVEYVATQVVADYIRYCVRWPDSEAIDGVLYLSSVRQGGKNIVMFVDPMPNEATELPLVLVGPVRRHRVESLSAKWCAAGQDEITPVEPWWRTNAHEHSEQVPKYLPETAGH